MENTRKWDSKLEVDVEVIDTQHKVILGLINDLSSVVKCNSGKQVVDTLFAVIMNYAFKHFATEEKYLSNSSEFSFHCYQHYQLLKKLNDYILKFRNERGSDMDPGVFLNDWFIQHIIECDIPSFSKKAEVISFAEEIDDIESFDEIEPDKRKHKRVRYDAVVETQIMANCFNATTLKKHTVTLIDFAVGGLKLYTNRNFKIDDVLIISCRIGRTFKMKEQVRVKNRHEHFYGVEFLAPKQETILFFTELYGAVNL